MKYTVIWLQPAEDELAVCWLDATERAAVTRAAAQIDDHLKRHPADIGESREEDLRIFFVAPLGVLNQISEQDHRVEVIHVWKFA